ncbi:MAG: M14 family metallopeptidase [bacterium]|nr:M14 family metallopeptidase [bacterium]
MMIGLCLLPLLLVQAPASGDEPATRAASSAYTETSRAADVDAFLAELRSAPHAQRIAVTTFGSSHEERSLVLVTVAAPRPAGLVIGEGAVFAGDKLRILVNANIHGGEVEGKEAVQELLRELANGAHGELLEHAVLYFVPIYNVDGNERISTDNRKSQNGPSGGVGERANAQGFDLNRDFVKAESPECRALMGLFRKLDPHVFMDLHTTNGSNHGYHLTYAPSLSTNVDAALDAFSRDVLLPEVTGAVLASDGFRIWHYGNFSRRGARTWSTYDHRPRFGTNYYGLRNRIAVLSEAFSYVDFHERVRVTRAFVLETMRAAVRHREVVRALCEAADARAWSAPGRVTFGVETKLADDGEAHVLVGSLERDGGRRIAGAEWAPERMPVRISFDSARRIEIPEAWAVLEPTKEVIETLRRHGVVLARVKEETEAGCEAFVPSEVRKARREFQGHLEVSLVGEWRRERRTLPVGTLIVTGRQRLARVAAQLLEPESEDSLSTWNFLDAATRAQAETEAGSYPVVRVFDPARVRTEPIAPLD